MPLTENQCEQLLNDIKEIKDLLKGYDGYPGLCSRFVKLEMEFLAFRRIAVGIISFAVGAGLLGAGSGIWALFK